MLIFITFTFIGCATLTEYQTPEMLKIKSSIDRPKALNTFSSILLGSNDASGLCYISGGGAEVSDESNARCKMQGCYGYARNSEGPPSFTDKGISVRAWKSGKPVYGLSIREKEFFIKTINFEDITRVIISNPIPGNIGLLQEVFPKCKGDYLITVEYNLSEEEAQQLSWIGGAFIEVSKNDIDALMASLSILAPKAKLLLP